MDQNINLLQGSWSVATLEVEGLEMPAAMLGSARIVVRGNRFHCTGMGAEYTGTMQVDAAASPARLDMKFDSGPEKGNTNLGIYELSGDTWKMCLATRGTVRPARFASTAGSGFALETLSRVTGEEPAKVRTQAPRKAAPAPGGGADATEFEGEWRMASGVINGEPMDKSATQWVKRVTRGNQTTVFAGPQAMLTFEFTSDPTSSPKTIEYFNTAGANKGKSQHGIYEITGGLLQVCVSAPGAARPARFESTPGDGATLTVWKRT